MEWRWREQGGCESGQEDILLHQLAPLHCEPVDVYGLLQRFTLKFEKQTKREGNTFASQTRGKV